MLKVLTAEQMREVDRLTTERYGIPSILLMENAAHAVARVITEKLGGSVKGKSVLILCGKGNNGGDGAAIGRLLAEDGAHITLILFAKIEQTKGDARLNFDKISSLSTSLAVEICEAEEWWQAWEFINKNNWEDLSCVVDAVFGTGLRSFRDDLNEIVQGWPDTPHVAVDLPSGLMADSPDAEQQQYSADLTVTFTAPKAANVMPPANRSNGELFIADIGTPRELIDEQPSQLCLAERSDAANWLARTAFSNDSYKNKRGHTLIVAGSQDYSGAAVLAANSAMRSGVGLTTLMVPESVKAEVAARVIPEVIVKPIAETDGELSADAYASSENTICQADAILVGPGLSATDQGSEKLVREIVESRTQPVIVDAGALWFFNPPNGLLQKPAREQGRNTQRTEVRNSDTSGPDTALADARASAQVILTPHEGEFLRLTGRSEKLPDADRVDAVREYCGKHGVYLILKGERVLTGAPDGRVVVNPTGNSGVGKAGNGDTLAGLIAGFVAQSEKLGIDIFETLVAAVYIAGMAADIAERKYGKRVMTASDVRECLAETFQVLSENHDREN